MKQRTAKSVVEALDWIHNNAHPEVGTDYHPVRGDEMTHVYFKNYFEKMRIPIDMYPEVSKLIRPNKRAFDTRMFALTRKGRSMLI